MHVFFDRAGNPMEDLSEWSRLRRDPHASTVARTELPGGVIVSTVWLGINLSVNADQPLIFETMIFGGPHDNAMWRYPTEPAALAWHDQIVTALRAGREP